LICDELKKGEVPFYIASPGELLYLFSGRDDAMIENTRVGMFLL
jgi:hypothetical protein